MKSKLPSTGTSIFTVMSALATEHDAINLSQGFPNFPIDERLKAFVNEGLELEHVQYAPMAGRLDLRHEISKKIQLQHGIRVNPEDEITITAGATQAIFSAIATLVTPNDEVILFDPAYDCYDPGILVFGGIPVHLKLRFPDYSIDWNEVAERVTARTKLIIVNNPHNPAGSVWTAADIAALEQLVTKHPHLYIISDEVYEHLQFSGVHQSVLKSDLLRSRSFVAYSFGKTFHVTGWKLGYCVAPKKLTEEFRKVHQFNVFCVNNTIQYAVAKYLAESDEWQKLTAFYAKKRDTFQAAMKNSGFKPLACEGTYFSLFDYSGVSNLPDQEFTKWLTREHGVASIPVSVFYQDLTDHKVIRFCFAKTDETLLTAAEKLCRI
jgi:methionine transaminase